MSVPIEVSAGGSVPISVTHIGGSGSVVLSGAFLGGAGTPPSIHQLIPAYIYPAGETKLHLWHEWCEEADPGSTVIMDPENGQFTAVNSNYASVLKMCTTAGQKVVGYVATEDAVEEYGGHQTVGEAEKDIEEYYRLYPEITGIFLDQMSPYSSTKVYYEELYNFVHEKYGGTVVGNPGASAESTSWQLGVADAIDTFEGKPTGTGPPTTFAEYISSPSSWVLSAEPDRIANIIHGASETQMEEDCTKAEENNAGLLYVTSLGDGMAKKKGAQKKA